MSHNPGNSSSRWPKIGEHFKKPLERTQNWIKLGGNVTSGEQALEDAETRGGMRIAPARLDLPEIRGRVFLHKAKSSVTTAADATWRPEPYFKYLAGTIYPTVSVAILELSEAWSS